MTTRRRFLLLIFVSGLTIAVPIVSFAQISFGVGGDNVES